MATTRVILMASACMFLVLAMMSRQGMAAGTCGAALVEWCEVRAGGVADSGGIGWYSCVVNENGTVCKHYDQVLFTCSSKGELTYNGKVLTRATSLNDSEACAALDFVKNG